MYTPVRKRLRNNFWGWVGGIKKTAAKRTSGVFGRFRFWRWRGIRTGKGGFLPRRRGFSRSTPRKMSRHCDVVHLSSTSSLTLGRIATSLFVVGVRQHLTNLASLRCRINRNVPAFRVCIIVNNCTERFGLRWFSCHAEAAVGDPDVSYRHDFCWVV